MKTCKHLRTASAPDGVGLREANPMSLTRQAIGCAESIGLRKALEAVVCHSANLGSPRKTDAQAVSAPARHVVSTDPPYYDNIGYADLSDFFYVWLRRRCSPSSPNSSPHSPCQGRGTGGNAISPREQEEGRDLLPRRYDAGHAAASPDKPPGLPVTIYYAFKQTESEDTASTGWETFLDAVIRAGF